MARIDKATHENSYRDKDNYSLFFYRGNVYRRVHSGQVNRTALDIVKTTITTTRKKIDTPENCDSFFIINKSTTVTVNIGLPTASTDYPLSPGEKIELTGMKLNNDNEIYGITASTADVYCVGVYKS